MIFKIIRSQKNFIIILNRDYYQVFILAFTLLHAPRPRWTNTYSPSPKFLAYAESCGILGKSSHVDLAAIQLLLILFMIPFLSI